MEFVRLFPPRVTVMSASRGWLLTCTPRATAAKHGRLGPPSRPPRRSSTDSTLDPVGRNSIEEENGGRRWRKRKIKLALIAAWRNLL